ncbi:MAG: hypothetical protein K0U68_04440 [Gammaproteobacteria bacterium]|nr:hypothetical protein [Gammaproteobacteria bacterium]
MNQHHQSQTQHTQTTTASDSADSGKPGLMSQMLPWIAGVGFAVGNTVASTSCTVPQQGKCSGCGGCAVALGALVVWALKNQSKGKEFYLDEKGQDEFDRQANQ